VFCWDCNDFYSTAVGSTYQEIIILCYKWWCALGNAEIKSSTHSPKVTGQILWVKGQGENLAG